MQKHFGLICFLALPGAAFGAGEPFDYSVEQFQTDCRQAEGEPRVFANSAVCESATGQNIICLRQHDVISFCKLDPLPTRQTNGPDAEY